MIPQSSHNDPTIIPWSSHYRDRASHCRPTFVIQPNAPRRRDKVGYTLIVIGATLMMGAWYLYMIGGSL